MLHHPECKTNEFFVGNTTESEWPSHQANMLKTARLGDVAYSIDGEKLNHAIKPLFIGAEEHDRYDKIMMARLNRIRLG